MLEQGYKRSSHFWHDSPLPARTNGIKHLTPGKRDKLLRTEWLWCLSACTSQKMVRPPCSPPLTVPYLSWDVHGSCSFYWPWSDMQDQRISFGWKIISSSESFPGNTVRGVFLIPTHLWAKQMSKTLRDLELSPGWNRSCRSVRALPLTNRFLQVKTSVF